jgi:hypothetical protein
MTEPQRVFAEIESFRTSIEKLSRELADDRDFWPAYAEKANALEGRCPLQLRDYARESILRIARKACFDRGAAFDRFG